MEVSTILLVIILIIILIITNGISRDTVKNFLSLNLSTSSLFFVILLLILMFSSITIHYTLNGKNGRSNNKQDLYRRLVRNESPIKAMNQVQPVDSSSYFNKINNKSNLPLFTDR